MNRKKTDYRILVVEDNATDYLLLRKLLQSTGLPINTIFHTERVSDASSYMESENIDLIFLDLTLPDSSGIETFLTVNKDAGKIPVIILSAVSDTELAINAIKEGAQDYLIKGEFDENLLGKAIRYGVERKRILEIVSESNERYKNLFDHSPMAMWVYEKESGCFLEVNQAATEQYGYTRAEFLELSFQDLQTAEEAGDSDFGKDTNRYQQGTKPMHTWKLYKKNGELVFAEVTTHTIVYDGKKAELILAKDISDKVRLQKELKHQEVVKQRQITRAVIHAQERERIAIGRELHDNVNQILGAAKLYINTALTDEPNNRELLVKSCDLLNTAINELRKMSKTLSTTGVGDVGLVSAIEDLVEDIQMTRPIKIEFNSDYIPEDQLDEQRKLTIFRIIQEQLTNIIKHANASSVCITLTSEERELVLTIKDNGEGFNTKTRRKGVGITNIISRVEMFNGVVNIYSKPEKGCKLLVHLPFKNSLKTELM